MGRVKKSGAGKHDRRKSSAGARKVGRVKAVEVALKSGARRTTKNGRVRGRSFTPRPTPERKVVRVVDLDPYEKCGPGTSVQRLIRVDEMIDHAREAHLVFFDRHGWYCEHGPSCPAVGHARKHAERASHTTTLNLERTGTRKNGSVDPNGRMRA